MRKKRKKTGKSESKIIIQRRTETERDTESNEMDKHKSTKALPRSYLL